MIISFNSLQVSLENLAVTKPEKNSHKKIDQKAQDVLFKNTPYIPSTFEERLTKACQKGEIGYVSLCLTFPQTPAKAWNVAIIESILAGNSGILELILRFVEIPKRVLMMGAEVAFGNNRLREFKIVTSQLEAENPLVHTFILDEVKRGQSVFIPAIVERFKVPQELIHQAFLSAVRLKNFEALQTLFLYAIDPDLVLAELLEVIDRNDEDMARTLFMHNLQANHIEAAFLRASFLKRYPLLQFFLKRGASPEDLGKALLEAVERGEKELVVFLLENSVLISYLEKGFERSAQTGDVELLRIFLETMPSNSSFINALRTGVIAGHFGIVRELTGVYFYSLHQLLLAQDLAFENQSSEIYDWIESIIISRFESAAWEVDLEFIRQSPFVALEDWSAIFPKPMIIHFKKQQGIGEGLTRQFYNELAGCLAQEMLCDRGLFKRAVRKDSLAKSCEFFSFMLENGLKTGNIFPKKFLKILKIASHSSIFSSVGMENIFLELVREKKEYRDKLYSFLKNPKDRGAILETARILSIDAKSWGFANFPIQEQVEAVRDHLIQKYGYWLGVDYLRYLRQKKPFSRVLESLVTEMSEKFFSENLADTAAVIEFCQTQKKEILDLSSEQLEHARAFLKGASRMFFELVDAESFEQLEGIALERIDTLAFSYRGDNRAIQEKVELIKNFLGTKSQRKDLEFIKKFLFYITGSSALNPNLVIGIQEIEKEKYPQAQTCFHILKLPVDYEKTPCEFETWQERFLYKLQYAIEETGYQLEEN